MSPRRWTDVLCTRCGGNGVVKIPGGVSTCDRCEGRCYEPESAVGSRGTGLRERLEAHVAELQSSEGRFRPVIDWETVRLLRESIAALSALPLEEVRTFDDGWRAGLKQAREGFQRHEWQGQLGEILAVVDAVHEKEP